MSLVVVLSNGARQWVGTMLCCRVVPETGLRTLSTGSNRSVGCWVGNPAGAIEFSRSLSFPVDVRRRTFGGLWCCRCFGETVWSGGAGDRAETSIDRFQSVRGLLGGESRGCDRGLRVIVVHLSSPQTPRSPFPSLPSAVTQVRGHSEWILRVVVVAPNESHM